MQTGVLLNGLVCFLIFIVALTNAIRIYRQSKGNMADMSVSGFWFLTSLSWLSIGLSLIVSKYGLLSLGIAIDQYFTETTVFIQIAVGSYYAAYRVFKNHKLSTIIFIIFSVIACLSLLLIYQNNGVMLTKSSYFIIEYRTDQIPWQIFQTMFAIVMLAIAFDVFRSCYFWFKKSIFFEPRYLLVGLSICAYGAICYFEEQGYTGALSGVAAWIRLAMRILLILCAQVVYLAYSKKEI
jgi:hypothetical protein